MKLRYIAERFRYATEVPRGFTRTLDSIDYWGKLAALGTFVLDAARNFSYKAVDLPGYLLVPASLFTAGQTATMIKEFRNDPEWYRQMPVRYRLPRYAQRLASFIAPAIALAGLSLASIGLLPTSVADKVVLGAGALYVVSEVALRKWAEKSEGNYLMGHPEIMKREFEKLENQLDAK